jgi:hypothetical protein
MRSEWAPALASSRVPAGRLSGPSQDAASPIEMEARGGHCPVVHTSGTYHGNARRRWSHRLHRDARAASDARAGRRADGRLLRARPDGVPRPRARRDPAAAGAIAAPRTSCSPLLDRTGADYLFITSANVSSGVTGRVEPAHYDLRGMQDDSATATASSSSAAATSRACEPPTRATCRCRPRSSPFTGWRATRPGGRR